MRVHELCRLPVFCVLLCLCLLPARGFGTAVARELSAPLQVAAGTNLITLAREYCYNPEAWKIIAQVNGLSAPYLIYADREIEVPVSLLRVENVAAEVVSLSGAAVLEKKDGTRVALAQGGRVLPGESVQTGEDAFVQLLFPNGAYTRIEPGSLYTLSYLFSVVDGKMKAEARLLRGRIVQRIDRELDFNESLRARTPMVITGIRGTEYRLKADDGARSTVETLRGEVGVRAARQTVRLQPDEGLVVEQGRGLGVVHRLPAPPAVPVLAEVYRSLPARILLPATADIQGLKLRLSGDEAGQATVYEYQASAGEPLVLQDVPDGRYFAFFTATDRLGFESREQGPQTLVIRTVPPAPLVSAPRNGSILWGEKAEISWLQSGQAVAYRAQVGRDALFGEPIDEQQLDTGTYVSPVLAPGTYFFRVQALAADGFVSDFSAPLQWQQREIPAMGGMESSSAKPPVLQWRAMGEGWRYDLQVAGDREFSHLIVDEQGLTEPAYAFTERLDPGTYSIRLRGHAEGEPDTPWTPTQTMTVRNEPKELEGGLLWALLLGIVLL